MSSIFERIQRVVDECLGVGLGSIKPETRLSADLNADSLDAVELVMAFEEEFGVSVDDESFDKFEDADAPLSEIEAYFKAAIADREMQES